MAKTTGTAVNVMNTTEVGALTVLGLDHGNVWVKGYAGSLNQLLLPNQILEKDLSKSESLFKSKLILNEYVSNKYDDEVFQWGQDVYKGIEPISTYTSQDRYIQKAYKLLTEFALTDLAGKNEKLIVVTGCPSRQKDTQSEVELKKAFDGTHVITKNGEDFITKVVDLTVLTQPLGTVMYLYMNDEGNIVDPDLAEEYVGVIDVGGGTLDLDGIKDMDTVMDDRETIDVGLYKVYQQISDYINNKDTDAKSTPKLVEFQILGDNPESYKVSKRSSIDISKVKEKAFRKYMEKVIPMINTRWTNRSKFDRIILTGGGSKPLAKYFLEWEKDIIVIDEKDSQMANVIGFYRYGVAKKKLLEMEATTN